MLGTLQKMLVSQEGNYPSFTTPSLLLQAKWCHNKGGGHNYATCYYLETPLKRNKTDTVQLVGARGPYLAGVALSCLCCTLTVFHFAGSGVISKLHHLGRSSFFDHSRPVIYSKPLLSQLLNRKEGEGGVRNVLPVCPHPLM